MLLMCFRQSSHQHTVVGGESAADFVVLVQADAVIRSESEVSHLLPLLPSLRASRKEVQTHHPHFIGLYNTLQSTIFSSNLSI